METINDRVMILRKKLEMNQTEFAKTLAIKQAALSMIENGQREVSEKNIKLICATHNVNIFSFHQMIKIFSGNLWSVL